MWKLNRLSGIALKAFMPRLLTSTSWLAQLFYEKFHEWNECQQKSSACCLPLSSQRVIIFRLFGGLRCSWVDEILLPCINKSDLIAHMVGSRVESTLALHSKPAALFMTHKRVKSLIAECAVPVRWWVNERVVHTALMVPCGNKGESFILSIFTPRIAFVPRSFGAFSALPSCSTFPLASSPCYSYCET